MAPVGTPSEWPEPLLVSRPVGREPGLGKVGLGGPGAMPTGRSAISLVRAGQGRGAGGAGPQRQGAGRGLCLRLRLSFCWRCGLSMCLRLFLSLCGALVRYDPDLSLWGTLARDYIDLSLWGGLDTV